MYEERLFEHMLTGLALLITIVILFADIFPLSTAWTLFITAFLITISIITYMRATIVRCGKGPNKVVLLTAYSTTVFSVASALTLSAAYFVYHYSRWAPLIPAIDANVIDSRAYIITFVVFIMLLYTTWRPPGEEITP